MHDIAAANAVVNQKAYVDARNVGTRDKVFAVNDRVLVLLPTSSNRLKSQWTGPATVVKVFDDNSYTVSLGNGGGSRVLHADLLRPYVATVSSVGVIYDDDEDFGNIETYPLNAEVQSFEENLSQVDVSHLSSGEKDKLLALLRRHQNVFNDKPGRSRLGAVALTTKPGFEFNHQKPYRVPEKIKAEVQRQLDELLADGRIAEEASEFAHPLVAVAKRDKSTRLCVDFRLLNAGLVPNRYRIPRGDELVREVAHAKFLSSLDVSAGFWNLPIRTEDQFKTGFTFDNRQYVWRYLPFGIATASALFQAAADAILRPHEQYAKSYIDDCAIFTKAQSFDQHLVHLDKVLQAYTDAGFSLKLSKCRFVQAHIDFLGFRVGQGTLTPLHDRLQDLRNIPVPTTKKAVRSFLGAANFFRSHTANYTEIAAPLMDLTKKDVRSKVKLDEQQLKAFNDLKEELCKATELYVPDYTQPFLLYTDASAVSTGAALCQEDAQQRLCPVAFSSKKLSPVQQRWAVGERESFSLVKALDDFESIIWGCRIIVLTDHLNLRWLQDKQQPTAKLLRWALKVSRFDIELKYLAGSKNELADFLSRYANADDVVEDHELPSRTTSVLPKRVELRMNAVVDGHAVHQ
jgi:hypothetical protein